MSHYSNMGYGLLVYSDNEYDYPDGIETELVGDYVLGEECGLFYMVQDIDVRPNLKSENYISEWVTEYTVEDISQEIQDWLSKVQEELGDDCKLGVFNASCFS